VPRSGDAAPPNPAYPPIRPSRSVELLSILCGIEGEARGMKGKGGAE
jgi:hypothetical protein